MMSDSSACTDEHRMKVGITMYEGKRWTCLDCGKLMECVDIDEHREVNNG